MWTSQTHDVVVLLYDGVQMLDVTGPIDAFASANALGATYRITHASLTGADVIGQLGRPPRRRRRVDDLPAHIGTLLVPGSPNWQASITDTALVAAVRDLCRSAADARSRSARVRSRWRRRGCSTVVAPPPTGSSPVSSPRAIPR